MSPENLDEKTQSWHADATLSPTFRARLSQAAPSPKRHSPTSTLRYGLAACIGVGLGLGYVASHRLMTPISKETQNSTSVFDNATFLRVAATIKHWREPDRKHLSKDGYRWEAILFTDLECTACWKVYPILREAKSLRVGICHFPLTDIHPNAFDRALEAEINVNSQELWSFLDRGELGNRWIVGNWYKNDPVIDGARQRIERMKATALAAEIHEVPTLWLREKGGVSRVHVTGVKNIQTVLEGIGNKPQK